MKPLVTIGNRVNAPATVKPAMHGDFKQRSLVLWLIATLIGVSVGVITAAWLDISLTKAIALAVAATLSASAAFAFFARSFVESLQQLKVALQKGEEPNALLLQELGALGEALAAAWQRWSTTVTQLREEQALLQAMLKRMAEAVVVADEHGNILLINPAAEQLFHSKAPTQRRVAELRLPFELLELMQRALHTNTPQMGEVQMLRPDERLLDAYAAPLSVGGKTIGVLLVARDLTELKRLEQVRKDFVANVSHELRTPIATLRSLTEALLMGGKDDPEVRDNFLNAIAEETERMERLLDNLLALAQIESGKRAWLHQTVAVAEIVAQVVERFRPTASQKGLRMFTEVDAGLTVTTDPDALVQILSNLMDNAVKYTLQGEITVTAERIETVDGAWVVISVRDTGVGIPPEHLPRIFERFYRVDKARSRQRGGFGLGLSIAKHLAENLGGTITVQSQVGKGSTFAVWLPAG